MKKYCMLLRNTSGSVFLKDVAQAKSVSMLFPNYKLIWDPPGGAERVLLLDTSFSPLHFKGDFSWLSQVERVEVLPGLKKAFDRVFPCGSHEVSL